MPHLPSLESLWFGFTLTTTGCLERTNNPVGLSASKIWIPQGEQGNLYSGEGALWLVELSSSFN